MTEYKKIDDDSKGNPKANANCFSILFFWWMNDILATGSKRSLEQSDLYPLLNEDKTSDLAEKLEKTWNEEVKRHPPSDEPDRHRLFRALMKLFPWTEYAFLLSAALFSGLCNVMQPVILSLLLPILINRSDKTYWWAYVYGAGICFSILMRVLIHYRFRFNSALISMRWKAATIGLILKKVSEEDKSLTKE